MALPKVKAGFAKVQGEDFEYYVQSYSIILGRNSKKATVDLDLAGVGAGEGEGAGGMNISRSHARIFYDFDEGAFMLEILGKNGVAVNNVMKPAGSPPVPLHSQDLLQIGTRKFYFLLPAQTGERSSDQQQMNGGKRKRSKGTETPVPATKHKPEPE